MRTFGFLTYFQAFSCLCFEVIFQEPHRLSNYNRKNRTARTPNQNRIIKVWLIRTDTFKLLLAVNGCLKYLTCKQYPSLLETLFSRQVLYRSGWGSGRWASVYSNCITSKDSCKSYVPTNAARNHAALNWGRKQKSGWRTSAARTALRKFNPAKAFCTELSLTTSWNATLPWIVKGRQSERRREEEIGITNTSYFLHPQTEPSDK